MNGATAVEISSALPPVRVFVAEPSPLVRECLARALAAERGLSLVGAAGCDAEARDAVRAARPDIALVAAAIPREGGLALTGALRDSAPDVRVIIVGIEESPARIIEAIEAGAAGWTGEDASLDGLLEVVRAASRGEMVCPPKVTPTLYERIAQRARQSAPAAPYADLGLTVRQIQVLDAIAVGLSNKEIARQFCISTLTVKNHVHRLLERLGARSRVQALCYARSRNWAVWESAWAPERPGPPAPLRGVVSRATRTPVTSWIGAPRPRRAGAGGRWRGIATGGGEGKESNLPSPN